MIKVEKIMVGGWYPSIRGMRNPKNSWDKMDTDFSTQGQYGLDIKLGPNDLKLAKQLHAGGPVHSKYKRMLVVWMDVTAPLYWWKEYDTYKVGTVSNSCSTMHKIDSEEFTEASFANEYLDSESQAIQDMIIKKMNSLRDDYHELKSAGKNNEAKKVWYNMIQLNPDAYLQKRTIMLDYEVITNICMWRHCHKQDEWKCFIYKLINTLPYAHDIIIPYHHKEEILKSIEDTSNHYINEEIENYMFLDFYVNKDSEDNEY